MRAGWRSDERGAEAPGAGRPLRGWSALRAWIAGSRSAAAPALPPGTQVERDLAYGDDPAQRLDLYRPAASASPPLMVVVGGGAWAMGDKAAPATVAAKTAHWLPAGWAIASVGHRRLPRADPLEQSRDVARALAFLQQRMPGRGDQPCPVVVVGHSSGAHLVALLAADMAAPTREGARPWLASILLDSAALDVVRLMRSPHLPLHDRAFGRSEADWQQASPLHRLRGRTAPMLLVHSSRRPEAGEQARRFAAAVTSIGGRAEVLAVDLSHAEVNACLGLEGDYTARVDAFLREIMADRESLDPRPGP